MRIGCLQFAPQVGDVDNNLNRADSVLNKANPDDLDLLVLPELAFSGMLFYESGLAMASQSLLKMVFERRRRGSLTRLRPAATDF